jgi:predicted nucleic acid-binding protein
VSQSLSGWLLDTNVLSELRKPNGNPQVKKWIAQRRSIELYVSSVTFAEIRFGIGRIEDPARRHALHHWLDSKLRPWFRERVLEIDEPTILRWREIVQAGRKRGHTFSQPDLFIAASADLHGLCVATRNTADFVESGVAVVNPWTKG